MISEKLSELYLKAEDKYFDLLDFLDSKGVPVYKYSDFFENRGIPSFVVTIALIVLLIVLLSLVFFSPGIDSGQVVLSLKDSEGNKLYGVDIAVLDETGKPVLVNGKPLIFSGKNDGDTITIPGFAKGKKLRLVGSKQGFESSETEIMIGEQKPAQLFLEGKLEGIDAVLILVDGETGTKVRNASVVATWNKTPYTFGVDSNGNYKKNVPEGKKMMLSVKAEGYNDVSQEVVFYKNSPRTITLTPSRQGFVGVASLLISVTDEDGMAVSGAKVKITSKNSQEILVDDYTIQGTLSTRIQTGVPIRIIVQKKGYVSYDSDLAEGGVTLRERERKIDVVLKKGGKQLSVKVVNELGLSLENSWVSVYELRGIKDNDGNTIIGTEDYALIEAKYTTISGVVFEGLDSNVVLVTAHKDGYLAQSKKVDLQEFDSVEIKLKEVNQSNSARIDVYVVDNFGEPVGNAKVSVDVFESEGIIPYGYSELKTGIEGYAVIIAEVGKSYKIKAETEYLEGSSGVQVLDNSPKVVYVKLEKKPQFLLMVFKDVRGESVNGDLVVKGLDGKILYDGNLENSMVFLNVEGRAAVNVELLLEDYNKFEETVNVKGKDYVEVIVYNKNSNDLAPKIEFVGVENEEGENVAGVTPGAFYWLKFSVAWPIASEEGLVHFRTGNDLVQFADSENVALFEVSAPSGEVFYSTSYTPKPAPGNETIDRQNEGVAGEINKWAEVKVKKPRGNQVYKVRVRVSDYSSGTIPIHYRALAKLQENYYRMPVDENLGLNATGVGKSGLYAETLVEHVKIFEALPECLENICVAFNYVDDANRFISVSAFEAMQDRKYFLEAEITSKKSEYLQIAVSGNENIEFEEKSQGIGNYQGFVNRINNQPITDSNSKQIVGLQVSLQPNGKQRVRIGFTPKNIGTGLIDFKAIGSEEFEKELSFNIVKNKLLSIEVSKNIVKLGEKFVAKVVDEELNPKKDALVKVINKEGKVVASISGNDSQGKGRNGFYEFQGNLDSGLYTIEASAPNYASASTSLLITTKQVLSFPEEIIAKIPVGSIGSAKPSISLSEILSNNSEFNITELSYEVSNSEKFSVNLVMPIALGKNAKENIPVNVVFNGETTDSAEEEITLKIKGFVEGKFFAQTTSTIKASYNKKLDASCLKIEPKSIVINLLGKEGSTSSEKAEVKNECEEPIYLKAKVKEKTKKSFIIVETEDISLQPGETSEITFGATNLVERQFQREQLFSYEAIFDSNTLTKKVEVKVRLISSRFALSYPPQLILWLAQSDSTQKATAVQPIFVTNISEFPIYNVNFAIEKEYATLTNINLSVEPAGSIDLEKGQSIIPPKVLFAQSNSTISEPQKALVLINGRIGTSQNRIGQTDRYGYYEDYYSDKTNNSRPYAFIGANNQMQGFANRSNLTYSSNNPYNNYSRIGSQGYYARSGAYNYNTQYNGYVSGTEELLGIIDVTIYYSGYKCFKAYPVDDLTFNLSTIGGQVGKRLRIQNDCAEPIRVTGVVATSRELLLNIAPSVSVRPGQRMEAMLSVASTQKVINLRNYPIKIAGVTELSQVPLQSEPIKIDVIAGKDVASQYSQALKGVNISICGQETKEKVDLPKTGTDCKNSYCDAKSAGKYLAEKIANALQRAQSQAYSKKNTSSDFGCEYSGSCTFAQIGIKEEPFDLYLQNDAISIDVLRESLSGQATSTGFRELSIGADSYLIEPFDVTIETLERIAQSGYTRRIFLDNDFAGCGYYKVAIDGAFSSFGGQIDFTSPVLIIRAIEFDSVPRIITPECKHSIINLANFAPIDEGYTINNDRGSWLTSVKGEGILEAMARKIAREQFKSEERFGIGRGNHVSITGGALNEALTEICLNGSEKKLIEVKVNSEILSLNNTQAELFSKQVSGMVSSALGGNFGEKSCFVKSGEDYSCVRLNDISTIGGALKLNIPEKTLEMSANGGCVIGRVYSNAPEAIEFEIEPGEKFTGISRITISEATNSIIEGMKDKLEIQNITTESQANSQKEQTQNTTIGNQTSKEQGEKQNGLFEKENTKASKISFAEKEQETKQEQPTGRLITPSASGKIYKDITYDGVRFNDNIEPVRVMLEKGARKEDPYMKNILICAYPSTREAETYSYLEAKNSTFTVRAVNKSVGSRITPTEDGKITVSTGTLHPDDLVMQVTKNKSSLSSGKNYYFTLMWAGLPNAFEFSQYVNGLANLKKLDDLKITTRSKNLESTDAGRREVTKNKGKAIGLYFGTCLATSITLNTVLSGGSRVWGGIFDCVIPGMIAFGSDLISIDFVRDKVMKTIDSMPLVPERYKEWIKDKLLGEKPNYGEISFGSREDLGLDQVLTGATSGATRLSIAGWRTAIDPTFKEFKEEAVKAFRKELERTLPNKKYTKEDIDDLSKSYEKILEKRLSKGYEEAVKNANGGRNWFKRVLKGQARIDAQKVAEEAAKGVSAQEVLENISRAEIGEVAQAATTTQTKQVIKEAVAKDAEEIKAQIDSAKKTLAEIAEKRNEYLQRTGTLTRKVQSGNAVAGDRAKLIRSSRKLGEYQKKFIEARDALKRLEESTQAATGAASATDEVVEKASRELDEAVERALKSEGFTDDIVKASKNAGKSIWSSLKKAGIGIAKGAFIGAASNFMGMWTYNLALSSGMKETIKDTSNFSGINFTFEKGKTYKMIIQVDPKEGYIPKFEEVTNEKIPEMILDLQKNTGKQITSLPKDGKYPEQRELSLYLITADPVRIRDEMKKNHYSPQYITETIDTIIIPEVQELINRYKEEKFVSDDLLKKRYGEIPALKEALALTIIQMSGAEFSRQAKEELLGRSSYLKGKISIALDEMTRTEKGVVNERVGDAVFRGNGEKFVDNFKMWWSILGVRADTTTKEEPKP